MANVSLAQTLLQWGVLDELVPRDGLLAKARELAQFYVGKPPIATQMIKQSVNHIASALDQAIMHMDVDQNLLNQTTEDRAQAIKAYLAKSPPTFTGN